MASVIKGIYIDVNKSVEVNIKIEGRKLGFDLVYPKEKEDEIGFRNYLNNIRKMIKLEYHKDEKNNIDGIDLFLGRFKIGKVSDYQIFGKVDSKAKYHGYHYLNSSEERILSQASFESIEEMDVPFERKETTTPLTDLHTHLSGALKADDIISIAKKFNPHIDISVLKSAGIDVQKYESLFEYIEKNNSVGEKEKVARLEFKHLAEEDIEIYKSQLSVGVNIQETFNTMENRYSFRHPIVRLGGGAYDKNVSVEDLFKEQLRCLATHYRQTGVKYAELSMSEICKTPSEFL